MGLRVGVLGSNLRFSVTRKVTVRVLGLGIGLGRALELEIGSRRVGRGMRGLAFGSYHASRPPGRLHLRVRARELRVEAHIESRVEIDRALAAAQQAGELGAAQGGAGRWWLERSVREAVRGEVERLEGEHCGSHETVKIGWSVASRRARKSEARHDTGEAERRRCNHGGSAGAWGKEL